MPKEKAIVHIDMDAFFASIEQRDDPALHGKPVVVGSDPKAGKGRGVVSTCSYEARKFGIHSAMPISIAYRKCPHAIFLPVDMEKYERDSHRIYEILYSFTPDVEPISIDEAFLDITTSYHLFGTPRQTCELIKSKIERLTGLTASIGLAPVKMAAKIASDLNKPDGLVEVSRGGLIDFLRPLGIRYIWGLGKKSEEILNGVGIKTIGDLGGRHPDEIAKLLGTNGKYFWLLANGIDESPVSGPSEAKSISAEVTFEKDIAEAGKIESALMGLCERVSLRMRHENLKARSVTLKIRLQGFQTFTRSLRLSEATNFIDILYKETKALYNTFDRKLKKVRLVGVKASNFISADFNDTLFTDLKGDKMEKVHSAVDKIKGRFGEDSICRAGSIARGQSR